MYSLFEVPVSAKQTQILRIMSEDVCVPELRDSKAAEHNNNCQSKRAK